MSWKVRLGDECGGHEVGGEQADCVTRSSQDSFVSTAKD